MTDSTLSTVDLITQARDFRQMVATQFAGNDSLKAAVKADFDRMMNTFRNEPGVQSVVFNFFVVIVGGLQSYQLATSNLLHVKGKGMRDAKALQRQLEDIARRHSAQIIKNPGEPPDSLGGFVVPDQNPALRELVRRYYAGEDDEDNFIMTDEIEDSMCPGQRQDGSYSFEYYYNKNGSSDRVIFSVDICRGNDLSKASKKLGTLQDATKALGYEITFQATTFTANDKLIDILINKPDDLQGSVILELENALVFNSGLDENLFNTMVESEKNVLNTRCIMAFSDRFLDAALSAFSAEYPIRAEYLSKLEELNEVSDKFSALIRAKINTQSGKLTGLSEGDLKNILPDYMKNSHFIEDVITEYRNIVNGAQPSIGCGRINRNTR